MCPAQQVYPTRSCSKPNPFQSVISILLYRIDNMKLPVIFLIGALAFWGVDNTSEPITGSSVTFNIKNAGLTVEGRFNTFKANITYIKEQPEKSTFEGSIQTGSIHTGIPSRDRHLKKADYFDVAGYPQITFASSSVKSLGNNTLQVNGSLTIKKTTKPIQMIVTVKYVSGNPVFSTSLKLNRRDFGVGDSSWTLADDLTAYLNIQG
jgi:polyisoprenoid-binding protein YceI